MISQFSHNLQSWSNTPVGRNLHASEQLLLDDIFARCHGYYFAHLGPWPAYNYKKLSIKKRFILSTVPLETEQPQIISNFKELALANDSLDAILMPYVLEFLPKPHNLLREIARILLPGGNLILTGFNPWGLWGLWRFFNQWQRISPWNGHFRNAYRLQDWLLLLGFEIVSIKPICFTPPFAGEKILERFKFAKHTTFWSWSIGASGYIIWARKKTIALNPIKPLWKKPKKPMNPGLIESIG